MSQSAVKALIFDMDGVLVDSEPYHLLAYQQLMRKFGIEFTEEDNREFLGRTDYYLAQATIQRHRLATTPEAVVSQKESILAELLKDIRPRPGVIKVIEQAHARGLSLAVASSATLPTIELIVNTLGIRNYFQTLTSGEEVSQGKPAPDVFLLAAARLGVEPDCCLVIEDTYNGLCAATAAGMRCVAVPCDATRHQDHSAAQLVIETLEDLDLESFIN